MKSDIMSGSSPCLCGWPMLLTGVYDQRSDECQTLDGHMRHRRGARRCNRLTSLRVANAHPANGSGRGRNDVANQAQVFAVSHVLEKRGEPLVAGKSLLRDGIGL